MKNLKWQIDWYQAHSLEDKKNWYDEAAINYDRTRPRYPQQHCDRIIELTHLPANATILELGCGPGIATVELAQLGYSMVCLEPSIEACKLAIKNCQSFQNVQIINSTFEEWQLENQKFDAVLAATSLHWIAPEIRYQKTACALKDNGWLILLWNTPPQLEYKAYQLLEPVYQKYASNIVYESLENYQKNIDKLGEDVINSGYFNNLTTQNLTIEVTYSIKDYLALLSTLSPYIALEIQAKKNLFTDMELLLEQNFKSKLQLAHLSVLQLTQKK